MASARVTVRSGWRTSACRQRRCACSASPRPEPPSRGPAPCCANSPASPSRRRRSNATPRRSGATPSAAASTPRHAKGHLLEVAKAIYGTGSEVGEQWARKRRETLDEGRVDDVIAARPSHAGACEVARKNVEYFSTNRERMSYPTFRAMGLCVATGGVEGGCKHIVGARFKRAGMRWTVPGANAIIALRCAVESHRFDDFRERRAGAVS